MRDAGLPYCALLGTIFLRGTRGTNWGQEYRDDIGDDFFNLVHSTNIRLSDSKIRISIYNIKKSLLLKKTSHSCIRFTFGSPICSIALNQWLILSV